MLIVHLSPVDPVSVPEATGGYVKVEVEGASRLLFVSGQIPQTRDGYVPVGIEDQCEWTLTCSTDTWSG